MESPYVVVSPPDADAASTETHVPGDVVDLPYVRVSGHARGGAAAAALAWLLSVFGLGAAPTSATHPSGHSHAARYTYTPVASSDGGDAAPIRAGDPPAARARAPSRVLASLRRRLTGARVADAPDEPRGMHVDVFLTRARAHAGADEREARGLLPDDDDDDDGGGGGGGGDVRATFHVRNSDTPPAASPAPPRAGASALMNQGHQPALFASVVARLPSPPKRARRSIQLVLYLLWASATAVTIYINNYAAYTPQGRPMYLSCATSLWGWDAACGVDGMYCAPFNNSDKIIFRCPSMCSETRTLAPLYIGDSVLKRRSTYVIGSDTYRADSFVCHAALHAGLFADAWGGCGVLTLTGASSDFEASRRHHIHSVSFDSWFPKTFQLKRFRRGDTQLCSDGSWWISGVQVTIVLLTIVLLRPSVRLLFYSVTVWEYIHVVFFSDPVHSAQHISRAFGTFCVCIPIAYLVHRMYAKHVLLPASTHPFEAAFVFFLPSLIPLYINHWSTPLPPLILNARLFSDPGQLVLFLLLISGIAVYASLQMYRIWKCTSPAHAKHLIVGYGSFAITYLVLPYLTHLAVHLHHWFLAALMLPLTRTSSPPGGFSIATNTTTVPVAAAATSPSPPNGGAVIESVSQQTSPQARERTGDAHSSPSIPSELHHTPALPQGASGSSSEPIRVNIPSPRSSAFTQAPSPTEPEPETAEDAPESSPLLRRTLPATTPMSPQEPRYRRRHRLSMLLFGLCVGLFINGAARWGLDPLLVPIGADIHVGEPRGTISAEFIPSSNKSILQWELAGNTTAPRYAAFSLTMNDVEVYRGTSKTYDAARKMHDVGVTKAYFRVAPAIGRGVGDWSAPLVVEFN